MMNNLNIRTQDNAEKKLGFKIEGSYTSPIGLIVEDKFRDIEDLIRLSAFTLFLERRHLDAGMPECCVEGKNIRRLAVLLLRNRNVKHIILLQNEDKMHLDHTIENIRSLISGTITNEKLDYIWTRGRFLKYKFSKEELKSAFKAVTEGLEEITYSDHNLHEKKDTLIKKMKKYLLEIKSVVPSPSHSKSFFVVPSSLDDYIPKAVLAQDITPNNVLCGRDVITLFQHCEHILFAYGYEVKDHCDIGRWQLGQEVILKLDISKKENDLEWKEILESFLTDIKSFLGNIGIKDAKNKYKDSEFYDRLFFEYKEGRKIRHKDFVERISDDIKNRRFGDSNALTLLVEEDDLSDKRESKIGWSGIRCYMRPQRDYVSLSLSHDLRSIDLYDGFPVNLFFCLEYSSEFVRDIVENIPYELKPKVTLEYLNFIVYHLHAYLDDLPVGLVRNL